LPLFANITPTKNGDEVMLCFRQLLARCFVLLAALQPLLVCYGETGWRDDGHGHGHGFSAMVLGMISLW